MIEFLREEKRRDIGLSKEVILAEGEVNLIQLSSFSKNVQEAYELFGIRMKQYKNYLSDNRAQSLYLRNTEEQKRLQICVENMTTTVKANL